MSVPFPLLRVLFPFLLLALAGCATVPHDRGMSEVQNLIVQRDAALAAHPLSLNTSAPDLDAQVERLLSEPMAPERAVGVALLRNPRVQLAYARLGLEQADWVEASRLSNPVLSLSALESSAAGERTRLGYGLAQNFTDLLFLRMRSRGADRSVQAGQAQVAAQIQDLATEVRGAWFDAAGAEQLAQMRELIGRAAAASATLAQRFHAAGNLSALELAREHAASEQAALDAEHARHLAQAARLRLNALMGLAPDASWTLDTALPLPVDEESAAPELMTLALQQRLDLAAHRQDLLAVEQVATLARRLRWLPFLEVGIEGEREGDGSRLLGPSVALELPLFGKSQGARLRTEALREQTLAQTAALESEIANEVAAAHAATLAARARVPRHRQGLSPQREAIVARMQELQNYMIVGQFELLMAKRDEFDAYIGYLEALRDYWLARTRLARAVGGALPSDARIGERRERAPLLPETPASDPHAHHHGGHH